jgi:hypothetical protein
MPWGVGDLVAIEHRLAAGEHVQILLGHRQHLPPEPLHPIPVEALGAVVQPLRIGEMPRAALVDVDGQLGPAPHQRARGAGVVEVDVGEQQCRRPRVPQPLQQCVERRARTAVDDHVAIEPGPDHAWATEVHEIDDPHRAAVSSRGAAEPHRRTAG